MLFVLVFVNSRLLAIIFETNNLQDILKHLPNITQKTKNTNMDTIKDTIVVFDIDHTIAQLSIDLDSWIPENITRLEKKGLTKDDAISFTLNRYFTLQGCLDLTPIGSAPDFIKTLQNQQIPVMALTNRSITVSDRTISELLKYNIDLKITCPCKNKFDFPIKYNSRFDNGIIFAASNDKGTALFTFFDKVKYTPKKVIFIDDKMKYVTSVEKAAKNRNIEYVGIRYSLQDELKKKFNFDQIEKDIHNLQVKIGITPVDGSNQTPITKEPIIIATNRKLPQIEKIRQ